MPEKAVLSEVMTKFGLTGLLAAGAIWYAGDRSQDYQEQTNKQLETYRSETRERLQSQDAKNDASETFIRESLMSLTQDVTASLDKNTHALEENTAVIRAFKE